MRGPQQSCGKSRLKTCTSCGGSCLKSATASRPSATQLALEGECLLLDMLCGQLCVICPRVNLTPSHCSCSSPRLEIPNPRRILKVRKSMSRIKCVLGERKRMKELIKVQAEEAQTEQQM